ncbi:MAG TPA: hypothetical protein VGH49_15170, partial [Xanthobacteraceae bacterium]
MSHRPVVKLTEAGRKAANELSAHTLRVARPLFWHIGARSGGVPKGASAFILQFERRYVAVTADHVINQYLHDLDADNRTVCQLSTCQVWPEQSLISRDAKLDIATFEINPSQLSEMNAD